MATAATVDLGPAHEPKEESIKAFKEAEHELKKQLVHMRHEQNKHEPAYFAPVSHLSDHELAGFSAADFRAVRVASSAYGLHLFGKVRIPALQETGAPAAYVHFRLFTEGPDQPAKLHSIRLDERDVPGGSEGDKEFRAIFDEAEELIWFDA